MKKRVVIFSAFLSPFRSGAEACAEEVALRLSDRFDITILTARLKRDLSPHAALSLSDAPSESRGDLSNPNGAVAIHRIGIGLPIDKWLYPFLAPFYAWKLRPQIIHGILETFAGLALMFSRWTVPSAKRILTLQTTNRNFLRGPILRSPDAVTAISGYLARQASEYGRNDVTIIPNGIPYEAIRQACGKTEKVPGRILFVGRLETMKGVDTLVKSFLLLQHPSATLHIVGRGSLFQEFRRKYSVIPNLKICGALAGESLLKEYAEAQIFCGLSRSEALGNVFLEAQAAGCAVLGTEIGGIPEIVKDGITGILTEPDNPELASHVITELLQNENLRVSLADAAVQHTKEYDWDAIAERYDDLYSSG